ncbi:MAG TPA: hypothetical protein VGZ22_27385 [Isosphaeraceae bacterium]|jgi:hypothetical protein|nr:hypothetical protein [Isosphaeraceae bacterium]
MLTRKLCLWLLPLAALLVAPGCDEEPAPSKPQIKTRGILRQTTQDVRPAAPEIQQGGAREAPTKITVKDPITMPGHVYVMAVNKLTASQVHEALELYRGEHGDYPKNHQEFMDEVLKKGKPDAMRLPTLPYYQEYGYDEVNHKLIILEYPDRKTGLQQQQQQQN